jgi:hypothetical protein
MASRAGQVYLNDEYRGQTPLPYTELPPGSYRLRVQLDGYETKVDLVDVIENADIQRAYVLTSQAQLTNPPAPPPERPARNESAPAPQGSGLPSRFELVYRLVAHATSSPRRPTARDALTRWQRARRRAFACCWPAKASAGVGRGTRLELGLPGRGDLIGQANPQRGEPPHPLRPPMTR